VQEIFQEVVREILANPELYATAMGRRKNAVVKVDEEEEEAGGWSGCAC
jgi:hypothetical protein